MSHPSHGAVGVPSALAPGLAQDSQPALRRLVRRVAQRDQAAFAALYVLLSREIEDLVRAQLNEPRQRAALVHATFVELWRLAPVHADHPDPRTWVHAIATARSRELLRRAMRPERDPWWADFEVVHDSCRHQQFHAVSGNFR